MVIRASWMALAFIAIWPATVCAQNAVSVSLGEPDTKTHFVWSGAGKNKNPDMRLNLVVENRDPKAGTFTMGEGFPEKIDVKFAKSEVGQIKWCSYVGTELDTHKCNPSKVLIPGGVINIP